METIAYIILSIVAICWIIGIMIGMINTFPVGIIGLLAIVGIGLLFIKVIKDRIVSKEDDYYSKKVDK
jgi:F0F1-type ATP synthase assembly protein I